MEVKLKGAPTLALADVLPAKTFHFLEANDIYIVLSASKHRDINTTLCASLSTGCLFEFNNTQKVVLVSGYFQET
jgi:hypothetical protein